MAKRSKKVKKISKGFGLYHTPSDQWLLESHRPSVVALWATERDAALWKRDYIVHKDHYDILKYPPKNKKKYSK